MKTSLGAQVRGVVEETKDLTRSAADRVKEDWQRTKEGTQVPPPLDCSSAGGAAAADSVLSSVSVPCADVA